MLHFGFNKSLQIARFYDGIVIDVLQLVTKD